MIFINMSRDLNDTESIFSAGYNFIQYDTREVFGCFRSRVIIQHAIN